MKNLKEAIISKKTKKNLINNHNQIKYILSRKIHMQKNQNNKITKSKLQFLKHKNRFLDLTSLKGNQILNKN